VVRVQAKRRAAGKPTGEGTKRQIVGPDRVRAKRQSARKGGSG
jgi:hypothetical protein